MTDAQQLVALNGLAVPRVPVAGAEGSNDHHTLAPSLLTREEFRDRVLETAGVQTLVEMSYDDFCKAPAFSVPVSRFFYF
jgi:hypothetical protein